MINLFWIKTLKRILRNTKEEQKMKFHKLIVIAAIVCLLVGASGAAMARNDCPDGSLVGGTYEEIVINEGFESCKIVGVYVTRRVLVDGADQFTMIGSVVDGNVRVVNTASAALLDNQADGGNLVAIDNTFSIVLRNIVLDGTIRVIDNTEEKQTQVLQNLIFNGNLRVNGHKKADVIENKVKNGDITCKNNDRLDSKDNDAIAGRVNCSRNLF